jgi:hypothetical protein
MGFVPVSLLCPFSFPARCWCRPAFRLSGCVVLWLPPGVGLPLGFAPWFRSSGGALRESARLSGGVALLLSAPVWLCSALCSVVPPPLSHGSQTHGVLLPW